MEKQIKPSAGGRALKAVLFFVVAVSVLLFFWFDLDRYFCLSCLKENVDAIRAFYEGNRLLAAGLYTAVYITIAALSLPGAAVMTLAGGALFGILWGTVMVSLASTVGATLAFLFARYVFRDLVEDRFASKLAVINRGIAREGGVYLFTLRLVPLFPFFVINLVMGLTSIGTVLFFFVSQAGMLPGTVVYVYAGTRLAAIDAIGDILSFDIILAFVLLGIFPFFAKRVAAFLRRKKMFSRFRKPRHTDYNMVVIGGGAAGLVAAYIAAAVRARVALIEEKKMGGDCLNTGCVPSKSLIASAKLVSCVKRSRDYGIDKMSADFDFAEVMERMQQVIRKIEPHDSVERYTDLGVDCFRERARIVSPFEVRAGTRTLTTKNIVIATGASPVIPDLPGLEKIRYFTSDSIWDVRTLPDRLVVLGAGPIGCELSQAFSRMGSEVVLVQRGEDIMKKEDRDAAGVISEVFREEGITVLTDHTPEAVEVTDGEKYLCCRHNNEPVRIGFDGILVALGRRPNIEGFGLAELGVEIADNSGIETNPFLQTNFPNIYCSGDVHGRYQFTHTAAHESWHAAVNALFGRVKKFRVDYRTIPRATFTDPEVAVVGLNETEARRAGIAYETVKYSMAELDRAITDSQERGFVKVLTRPGRDTILGVTIVAAHASDMIAEFVLAMKHNIGLNKILGTIHIYPTMAEANKFAAGRWKQKHAPEKLLSLMEKYHAWMRR